jgi:hypothetical protein
MKREAKNKLNELIAIRQMFDFSMPFDFSKIFTIISPYTNDYKEELEDNFYSIAPDTRAKSYLEGELSDIDALIFCIKDFNDNIEDVDNLVKVCNYIYYSCFASIKILMPLTEKEIQYKLKVEKRFNLLKSKDEFPSIFKSLDCYSQYLLILEKLNALDEKGDAKERRFQPIAKAIFDEGQELFIHRPLLKDYISFLNIEFNAGIKDHSKMSDGTNHEISVRNLL